MQKKYKISITVFATIILLYGLYFGFPEFIYKKTVSVDVLQAKYFNSTTLGSNPQKIVLGKMQDNAIYDLNFSFKFSEIGAFYPNLFQTANFNQGLRMEFGINTAAIIYNCNKRCPPNGYHVINLSKQINFSGDNYINISLRQGKYIKVKVNSNPELVITRPPPDIRVNNIIVGSGFDDTRPFSGEIGFFNIKVTIDQDYLDYFYYLILSFFYFVLIAYLKIIPTK